MSQPLIFALARGRLLEETLPVLAELGIEPNEALTEGRKLMFETNHPDIRLLVLRAIDVPPYVERGGAHLGIAGKDTLLEYGSDMLCEPVDLRLSKCRLMTATQKGVELPATGRIRVATKYVNVARQYYASRGRHIDPIKLYGAMELAPIVGLSDVIVDVVDTGNTLKANGLEARDLIAYSSARLVVSRVAMKTRHQHIAPIIERLNQWVKTRHAT
ncbi:MAG: ATP phosphoribosyltransferase [Gammaproteobacteria bacterium]|nr:MAG: ATP phosphoribosyltransferase [Gammaproteobacteria bacterium]